MRPVKANVVPAVTALAFNEMEHRWKVLLGGVCEKLAPRLWVRVPLALFQVLYNSNSRPEVSPVTDSTSR